MRRSATGPIRADDAFWQRPDTVAALTARDLGRVFRLYCVQTGASQTCLGEATGLSQGQVSQIMNRARKISTIEVLERIADGLAIPDHARMRLGLAPTSQRLSTPPGQRYDAASAIPAVEPGQVSPGTVAPSDWRDECCEVVQRPPAALGFAAPRSPTPIAGTVPTVPEYDDSEYLEPPDANAEQAAGPNLPVTSDRAGTTSAGDSTATALTQISTSNDAAHDDITAQQASTGNDREDMNMRRRALIQSILAGTGNVLSVAALGDLARIEQMRRELDLLLDSSEVGPATIERWEAVPGEYGPRYVTAAPRQLLSQVAGDFLELQHLLGRRHTTEDRIALTRIGGQLALLAGIFLAAMGDQRNAEAWYHTAGLAAREAQDRQLRGLALARSATVSLYQGKPERAIAKLAKAQPLLGQNATPGRARALVTQATALAKLGRSDEAQRSLSEAETTFQDMPASALADEVFGYSERQFIWYMGNAYTNLGMTGEADAMQRQALGMYRPTEYRPRACMQLDHARCMVQRGDVASACEYAQYTVTAVPNAHQGLVTQWAREFLELLPETSRDVAPARALRELLTAAN